MWWRVPSRVCKQIQPSSQWMSEVDLTLHDESQQYGNLDETAAIARLPRNCLVMWLEDHRQTPRGLHKSTAARRFRRKLLKRLLALRGNSDKIQPNTLYQIVGTLRALSCLSSGPINSIWPTPPAKCSRTWRTLPRSHLEPMLLGWMVLFPAQRLQSSGWPHGKMWSQ